MAGFAHLIPTHLPHIAVNGGGGSNGTGSGSSNGVQEPGTGSGPSQVTSGGS